eukprot:TRINITY_DN3777_c0_g2_i3.p1 TRINITY_DN3777_c0_g2~~TRINITY_DN3777_c0_g2_i3.p1  ORF type:complete len:143 (+),score=18.65 TRINITY_DN3777_c0_g2_i3:238-666(+)
MTVFCILYHYLIICSLVFHRISDTTDHTSPSDCTILGNVGNELGVIQPLARQQTLQNAHQISPTTEARISYSGTDHVINIDDREPQMQRTLQNSLLALSSHDAPSADDGIFTLWHSTPLVMVAVMLLFGFLLGLLSLFHEIG